MNSYGDIFTGHQHEDLMAESARIQVSGFVRGSCGGLLDWNCAIEVTPDYESRNRNSFLQFFKPVQDDVDLGTDGFRDIRLVFGKDH